MMINDERAYAAWRLAEDDIKPLCVFIDKSKVGWSGKEVMVYTKPFKTKGRKSTVENMKKKGWRVFCGNIDEDGSRTNTFIKAFSV